MAPIILANTGQFMINLNTPIKVPTADRDLKYTATFLGGGTKAVYVTGSGYLLSS